MVKAAQYVLFVTGRSDRSVGAIRRAKTLLTKAHGTEFDLMIIDVLEHPDDAARDSVVATPMLVRKRPMPVRRLVGDLSDADRANQWIASEIYHPEKMPEERP